MGHRLDSLVGWSAKYRPSLMEPRQGGGASKLEDADRAAIVAARAEGESVISIAKRYRLSRQGVYDVLKARP